jgi:hypothetical protein
MPTHDQDVTSGRINNAPDAGEICQQLDQNLSVFAMLLHPQCEPMETISPVNNISQTISLAFMNLTRLHAELRHTLGEINSCESPALCWPIPLGPGQLGS